jgi:hypothetical protein
MFFFKGIHLLFIRFYKPCTVASIAENAKLTKKYCHLLTVKQMAKPQALGVNICFIGESSIPQTPLDASFHGRANPQGEQHRPFAHP